MSNGNFAGGDGTADNPYLIEDDQDLYAVRNNLSGSYKLIKDIDLNISPYNTGEGWNPIGTDDTSGFIGVFNGNAHIIKNLFINKPSKNYVGLFGFAKNSIIKNLGIENATITGKDGVGGLVGSITNSNISNCYSSGSISGSGHIGGLVGYSDSGTIYNCYSNGSISCTGSFLGGITGAKATANISNCYSNELMNGSGYVGGLVGYTYPVTGQIAATNSYWNKEVSNQTISSGGTGLTTTQMKDPLSFVGWDTQVLDDGITKVWILKEREYPKLWFEKSPSKYLIKQDNKYYSIKNNMLTELGTPADDTQKKQWFNDCGVDDLKGALLTPDENGNKLIDDLDDKFEVRMMVPKD